MKQERKVDMGIIALVGLMALLVIPTALIEGTAQLWHRIKEEARFRRMLKGGLL